MSKRKHDLDGIYERSDSAFYWASYTDASGARVRCSTGIRKSIEGRREAEALLGKWRLEVHRSRQWGEQPSHTFEELMLGYLKATAEDKTSSGIAGIRMGSGICAVTSAVASFQGSRRRTCGAMWRIDGRSGFATPPSTASSPCCQQPSTTPGASGSESSQIPFQGASSKSRKAARGGSRGGKLRSLFTRRSRSRKRPICLTLSGWLYIPE